MNQVYVICINCSSYLILTYFFLTNMLVGSSISHTAVSLNAEAGKDMGVSPSLKALIYNHNHNNNNNNYYNYNNNYNNNNSTIA